MINFYIENCVDNLQRSIKFDHVVAHSPDLDDIKQNALAHYSSQNRAVTREDYIARVYAMPAKYGSVTKAYLDKDEQYWLQVVGTHEIKNPLAINLYTKTYDGNKNLTTLTPLAKQNLQTYLIDLEKF